MNLGKISAKFLEMLHEIIAATASNHFDMFIISAARWYLVTIPARPQQSPTPRETAPSTVRIVAAS